MERKEVEEKIYNIVSEIIGTPKDELTLKTTFIHDLCADSLTIVDIVSKCEDVFQINISDEQAENMKSIGDAVDYICSRLVGSKKK
ncbi:MAG: acyl carrier protein [Candidatus Brocadiae bacterium]|nr:acyl carrier protein [Candidatus Brocadiia bacterium]